MIPNKRKEFPRIQVANRMGNIVNFTSSFSFPITPSDTEDIQYSGASLYLNADGNVKISLIDHPADHTGEVFSLNKGYHPLFVRKIWDTGTDSISIIGLL